MLSICLRWLSVLAHNILFFHILQGITQKGRGAFFGKIKKIAHAKLTFLKRSSWLMVQWVIPVWISHGFGEKRLKKRISIIALIIHLFLYSHLLGVWDVRNQLSFRACGESICCKILLRLLLLVLIRVWRICSFQNIYFIKFGSYFF